MNQIDEIPANTTNEMPSELKSEECKDIGEIWKPIAEYKGFYEISNFGRVKSVDRVIKGKVYKSIFKKTQINKSGYPVVELNKNGKSKKFFVHRLVGFAFLFNIDLNKNNEINHKDGNKLNNYSINLEWCSRLENSKHAKINGLRDNTIGEKHYLAKLTNNKVKEIRFLFLNDPNFSTEKYAEIYQISKANINKIVNNRAWKDEIYNGVIKGELFNNKKKQLLKNCTKHFIKFTEEIKQKIILDFKNGVSRKIIREKYNISEMSLYRLLKKVCT